MIKQAELFLIEFYKSIRSLLIVIVFSKKHKITRCKKKKAIVLMNGPSLLGDIEEDNLSGDIYVSNDFASSKEFFILKPNNYVIVDPFFFKKMKGLLILRRYYLMQNGRLTYISQLNFKIRFL